MKEYITKSQVKRQDIEVINVYRIVRSGESEKFTWDIDNHRLLFHGSRPCNLLGLLSGGILMPRIVVSKGVKRTDYGFLGM